MGSLNILSQQDHKFFLADKGKRIYESRKKYLKHVTTDKFIILEDDTLPPIDAIPKLLDLLGSDLKIGIATAISTARGYPIHLTGMGVHETADFVDNMIWKRVCFSPMTKGIVEAQACGTYCAAIRTNYFKEAYNFVEDKNLFLFKNGSDTTITKALCLLGYKILADFSLWCEHMQDTPDGVYNYTRKNGLKDMFLWNEKKGVYDHKIV